MTNFSDNGGSQTSNKNFLRLRGLPYAATTTEIREFFGPEVNVIDVHIVMNMDGKSTGEAYVQVESQTDMENALKKDHTNMGKRYVEVFTIGDVETNQVVRRMQQRASASNQGAIRVRGIPFSCTEDELKDFFKGMNIVEVVFGKEPGGRASGECYIRFETKGDAERASRLSGQYLGKRYLEIFNVDNDQFENFKDSMNAPVQPSRPPRPFNETMSSGDSWSGYGPPSGQQRASGYSSYQEPANPYSRGTAPNYGTPQGYGAPPRSYGSNDYGNGRSYGNVPQGYETSQQQRSSYGNSYVAQPYSAQPYGSQPYTSPPGYNAPPHQQRSNYGNNYGAQSYGNPQHAYNQDGRQDDNKPYHYRGSGRCVAGEILNAYKLHMRGLPYRVTAKEIEQFFYPLQIVEIKTGILEDGRASGDAIVEFNNEDDAREAMGRDKKNIKTRYIELFSADNAKISNRTSYRAILSRNTGGYTARDQQQYGQNKPLFAPW